ncbi:MAG TPA: prepilin peptidase [Firmicutes bacterium]|jgi:prepilin signal peptidase PulO-like enzyme (type II secretory pathway)|nr:prepilin peptidase [Candidatus Fermentithermobacillaceae bacterium]
MAQEWFVNVTVLLIGLVIGSFGGVAATKLAAGAPSGDETHCSLSEQLPGTWEFLPLTGLAISLIVGKHRRKLHCGKFLFGRLAAELGTAIAFLILYRRFGLSLPGVVHMIIAVHLCILAATDIMYRLLPNRILLSASVFAVLLRLCCVGQTPVWQFQTWQSQIRSSLIDGFWGACLGFGFLFAASVIRPGAIGAGDVKMAGVIGFYLGFPSIVSGLAVGFTLSALCIIPMLFVGRLKTTDSIPLGVFLALGTMWTVAASWV